MLLMARHEEPMPALAVEHSSNDERALSEGILCPAEPAEIDGMPIRSTIDAMNVASPYVRQHAMSCKAHALMRFGHHGA